MPRGSGKNIGLSNILVGQPVSEDVAGNIRLADSSNLAFALAATGTPIGGVVTWQTDGIVTRADWTHISGSKLLTPGVRYFLSGNGFISVTGFQQVGVARSAHDLRIEIGESSVVTSVSSSTSPPATNLTMLESQVAALQAQVDSLVSSMASMSSLISSLIMSGAGSPSVSPSALERALYIDTASGTLYQWYSGAWH